MATKIFTSDLRVGMFVTDLDRPWVDTPFLLQGFLIEDDEQVAALQAHCEYVIIDRARSVGDQYEAPPATAVGASTIPPAAGVRTIPGATGSRPGEDDGRSGKTGSEGDRAAPRILDRLAERALPGVTGAVPRISQAVHHQSGGR